MARSYITIQSESDVEDFFIPKNLSPSELQQLILWKKAIDYGDLKQAKKLYSWMDTDYSESLQLAIFWHIFCRCKMDFLRFCIESCHFNANLFNADGSSTLHIAADNGWLEGVRYLVEECHCDPNAKDCRGNIPLHGAIYDGDLPTVRYFIETCQCNPEAMENGDSTALITASDAHLADMDIMEYLVEVCHVDVNARKKGGYPALFYAANSGQDDKVQYLCEHGANVNVKNDQGVSMLRALYSRYDELDADIGDGVTHEILYYLRGQGAVDYPE
ncbi:ankyrin repeat domain-containing protein [Oligosphaera ethanolica]|uniref:Ankyrin repeat protein n=1 Tax=Oligosphaera ethanolica TaxID=760260 RepID=A0AAE4ARW1_9BACT|nr:ankyrin repeat domain-containing protein [Oligosphaera ethanolica]MDQ0291882.1 hypothetical protein [Oligosphaera ethanolica]